MKKKTKHGNGLVQLINVRNSILHKWVKISTPSFKCTVYTVIGRAPMHEASIGASIRVRVTATSVIMAEHSTLWTAGQPAY